MYSHLFASDDINVVLMPGMQGGNQIPHTSLARRTGSSCYLAAERGTNNELRYCRTLQRVTGGMHNQGEPFVFMPPLLNTFQGPSSIKIAVQHYTKLWWIYLFMFIRWHIALSVVFVWLNSFMSKLLNEKECFCLLFCSWDL